MVHVKTQKGRGYGPAEQEPGRFHGVGPFDVKTGKGKKGEKASFSSEFGRILTECAAESDKVCAITAAMAEGTGLSGFAKTYPDRFYDVGIAEGHGVSMAAGLAAQGMIPVFAVYSTFLQRSYDMLIHDVALENLHVVLGVDRAGLVGADGETHHGCFDVLFLSEIPGFTVLCPANFAELRTMTRQALFDIGGPVAIRYPRGGEGTFTADTSAEPLVRLREGKDVTILSYGIMIEEALKAAGILAQQGVEAEVLKLNRVSPLDDEMFHGFFENTRTLLVLEDSFVAGCVGQRLAATLAKYGKCPEKLILKNLGKTFAPAGTVPELWKRFGLDAESVANTLMEVKNHGK